jgi:hypothetical protein
LKGDWKRDRSRRNLFFKSVLVFGKISRISVRGVNE